MVIVFNLISIYGLIAGLCSAKTRKLAAWSVVVAFMLAGIGLAVIVAAPPTHDYQWFSTQQEVGLGIGLLGIAIAYLVSFVLGIRGIVKFARRRMHRTAADTDNMPRLMNPMNGEIRAL